MKLHQKVMKKSQNSRNPGFSYYFCLMIEGSVSGSLPRTTGSESRRPKNVRIRIRNTERHDINTAMPKARGLEQKSGPSGWLEESGQAGVIL